MKTRTLSKNIIQLLAVSALCLSLGACAGSKDPDMARKAAPRELQDPLEPVNRAVFSFNNALDVVIIEPVAKLYRAVLPQFVRDGVQNFMRNLESPILVANNLLQGNVGGAGVGIARFAINTTAGVGGLVDVASTQGLTYKQEDFGQTLAVWGLSDGPYLVLPVIGPSTLRDTAGLLVDSYADPLRIVTENADNEWIYHTKVIVDGIDTRSRYIEAVADLRKNSLDYYASVRSIYTQKRRALINNEAQGANGNVPAYDYDMDY